MKMQTQDRRKENQKKIEQEKKSKIENMLHQIQLHGMTNQGVRSGDQSLNQTMNTINLQISQIDPTSKLQQINKSYFKGKPQGLNQVNALSNKIGKAQSYILTSPMRRNESQNNIRDTNRSRKFTDQQDLLNINQQSQDKMQIGTPSLGNDQTLNLEESVNFGNVANLAKLNRPTDDNIQMQIEEDVEPNMRYGQTAVGMKDNNQSDIMEFKFHSQRQQLLSDNDVGMMNEGEIHLNHHKNVSAFPDHLNAHNNIQYSDDDQQLQDLINKKRYVPVALCLETETEYHDVFRQILLSLFDLIRVPDNLSSNKIQDNRTMAFAELIAHVAFLKTIPAPPFNSVYNIHMMKQNFSIKESGFDQIPNKNQLPIKILFDVLDVKSIFYCWKALLFDKSLVVISSQYSLQFYIAEGLKQLLFPMTWQNTYIQPGNENLAGHCDGTMVCLYGSNSMINSYDYFEALNHPEMVIVDIDAGFANNIHLPCIPDENMYIRILNTLKNAKINQYDKAYPDSCILQDQDDFVTQVRETFFSLLKPFLSKAEEYIDKTVNPIGAYFQKYFKQDDYLEHFSNYGKQYYDFASALVQSSQFQHFCDEYSDDELNNFQMLKEIYKSRGEISHLNEKLNDNSRKKSTLFDGVTINNEDFFNCKKGKCTWPETEPVTFNFRMPQDKQRIMLFEKLHFMIDDSLRKKEKNISRKTNEHIISNKNNLMYEKYINTIKQLYPNKLRESRLVQQQQHQDMKNSQMASSQAQSQVKQSQPNNSSQQYKGMIDSSYTRQPNQRHQIGGQRQGGQKSMKRQGLSKKRGSSDSVNTIEVEGYRSSILEKVNRQFNKSNINNILSTPNGPSREGRGPSQGPSYNDLQRNVPTNLNNQLNHNNQSVQLPLDMVNSQDEIIQSFTHLSNSHNSVIELQEQQRIWAYSQRISRLMYGKQGLISFLHHIFGLLTDKQMKRVNYYFAISQQIDKMLELEKKTNQARKEQRKNNPIQEDEDFEEEKSPTKKPSKQNLQEATPISQASIDQNNTLIRVNTKHTTSAYNQSSQSSQIFKTEKEWLTLDHWESSSPILKRTYQFLIFRQKLYESFECPEDGYSHIWKLLIKFPVNKMKYFPTLKFQQIWESLTPSQQQEQFTRLGQKQERPQVQMVCKYYIKQRQTFNRSTSGQGGNGASDSIYSSSSAFAPQISRNNKSDESLFYLASVGKTYVQRKQEKKERESQLSQKFSTCKIQEATPFSNACNNSKEEAKIKYETKKQKQIDNIQKSICDNVKKRILVSMQKTNSNVSRNDQSAKLKIPPLSARAQTQEQFTFKTNNTQIEPLTPIERHRDDQNKTFFTRRDSLSIAVDYDMRSTVKKSSQKVAQLQDPVPVSKNMLSRILRFWRKNSKHCKKDGAFKDTELPRIQAELNYFVEKYINPLKISEPSFPEKDEIPKQVFFLNLFNFLILFHLAVQMLSNPESIQKLTNYNMWQSFLVSCSITLGFHRLNAFTIFNSIIRSNFQQPKISHFMLSTPAIEFQSSKYQVKDPHKFIGFGFYLPIKKMPQLRIFDVADFDSDLRVTAQIYLMDRIKIKEHFYYITLPKFLEWFREDFNGNYFIDLLELIDKDIFSTAGDKKIRQLLEKIKSKTINPYDFIIEYAAFCWEFKPKSMQEFFPDINQPLE